jgi:MFS transporter, ACS family, tartrate transporter
MPPPAVREQALDRARSKAYVRLIPLCFICYVIAYVDRVNVSIAKLTMTRTLPNFDNAVFGFGAGLFFVGYFLLEVPGTLLVEKWSARRWISRIMVSWGILAAMTALVKTPGQFYALRFLLGLAEAGFYPGVIVYFTHWFPTRDRARALAWFFVATPMAQIVSPKISNVLLQTQLLGLEGWQWVYIAWGVPAVALGIVVLFALTDWPRQAKWLTEEEKQALESELSREAHGALAHRMSLGEAFRHPKVLLLAGAYFLVVTGSYGVEFFMPTILQQWYALRLDAITWLVILPPLLAVASQVFVGWSSDRTKERRMHTVVPIACGAVALLLATVTQGHLALTVLCFMVAFAGFKAYLPAFWSLPNMFLTETAAAGSIGLVNSIGNLGGFVGPHVLGKMETLTGSFVGGLVFLGICMCLSAAMLFFMRLGGKPEQVAIGTTRAPVSAAEPEQPAGVA